MLNFLAGLGGFLIAAMLNGLAVFLIVLSVLYVVKNQNLFASCIVALESTLALLASWKLRGERDPVHIGAMLGVIASALLIGGCCLSGILGMSWYS